MDKGISVTISGLPGKMANLIANRIIQDGIHTLLPFGLSDPVLYMGEYWTGAENRIVEYGTEEEVLKQKIDHPNLIAIDFTVPGAVNQNAEFYCKNGIPFVMGTTGGNRNLLKKTIKAMAITTTNFFRPTERYICGSFTT